MSTLATPVTREILEEQEAARLSPRAMPSRRSRGRQREEAPCGIRPVFQRDRDRILHSKSFRRLMHKTQVFLAPASEHYRTRLTHTLEVSQIARSLARALRLNEDLVEAISLGHDLGHTPFGHAGEAVLNRCLKNGFRHAEQSLRVVDVLEKNGLGLNLTYEVRNGILSHSKSRRGVLPASEFDQPATAEAEVVRIADSIAYINHDIQDALRSGLLSQTELPAGPLDRLGQTSSQRIDTMVRDVIAASADTEGIRMSDAVLAATEALRCFLFERVYESGPLQKEFDKAARLLEGLFEYLATNPDFLAKTEDASVAAEPERQISDFLSGMTDRYALDLYSQLMLPHPWQGTE